MRRVILFVSIFALTYPALAQNDSIILANELGSVLGAEEGCGLKYNQDAIKAFVASKVKADDMGFAGTLTMMSRGNAAKMKSMSQSEKTAYCTQIERVARANKFIPN